MTSGLFQTPFFHFGQHYVSLAGLLGFIGIFAGGLVLARLFQSSFVRRLFSRFRLDVNFVAIVTTILSAASVVFCTVTALNVAGLPLAWTAPLPGIKLSLVQIFLLVAMVIGVFWFSSHTKRFLFNRFLVNSGLNRSLQYALAQIASNAVLVIGLIIVLQNTGINLGALAVFAGAVGVGIGLGLQSIASNSSAGSSFSRSVPSRSAIAWKSAMSPDRWRKFARAARLSARTTTSQ